MDGADEGEAEQDGDDDGRAEPFDADAARAAWVTGMCMPRLGSDSDLRRVL